MYFTTYSHQKRVELGRIERHAQPLGRHTSQKLERYKSHAAQYGYSVKAVLIWDFVLRQLIFEFQSASQGKKQTQKIIII